MEEAAPYAGANWMFETAKDPEQTVFMLSHYSHYAPDHNDVQ